MFFRAHAAVGGQAAAILATLAALIEPARTPASEPLDTTLKAWKTRQVAVRSLDFRAAGSGYRPKMESHAPSAEKERPPIPETTFPVSLQVIFDGNGRERLEVVGIEWDKLGRKYAPHAELCVFDGDRQTRFYGQGGVGFPNSHLTKKREINLARYVPVLPLMMIVRPLDGPLAAIQQPNVASAEASLNGKRCLTFKQGTDADMHLVWVDPERDYTVIRYHNFRRGKLFRAIDITPQTEPASWVPAAWTNVEFNNRGEVLESVEVTVTKSDFNAPLSESAFTIEYPPNTWIRDYDANEQYIIRANGAKRMLRGTELDPANYPRLLSEEGSNWALYIGVSVIAAGALIWWYRRRARR